MSTTKSRVRMTPVDTLSETRMSRGQATLRAAVLALGALVFLFPFYYMVVGSLQESPDPSPAGAFPSLGNTTGANYTDIDGRIDLVSGLVNSGIFTGGVILCTVVFGVLVGYALAILQWRGRGATFALVLPYAFIMALVGLTESLLTLTVVDEETDSRGRSNQDCVAQGLANVPRA